MYPRDYEETVKECSLLYRVDENLIYAIIKAESNFNSQAISHKGARGLMQLMENTAKDTAKKTELTIENENIADELLDSQVNIHLGTKYMAILLDRYQNIELALTAYNAGIGTVDTWLEKGILEADGSNIEKIPYQETNQYVRKILRDYKIYQQIYSQR